MDKCSLQLSGYQQLPILHNEVVETLDKWGNNGWRIVSSRRATMGRHRAGYEFILMNQQRETYSNEEESSQNEDQIDQLSQIDQLRELTKRNKKVLKELEEIREEFEQGNVPQGEIPP